MSLSSWRVSSEVRGARRLCGCRENGAVSASAHGRDEDSARSEYARVGDLVAYELVRRHFHLLKEIAAAEGGAVVKTIGDAVMATFPTPDRALRAALRIREAIGAVGSKTRHEDLLLKIGIPGAHQSIFAPKPVVEQPQSAALLAAAGITPRLERAVLKGVASEGPRNPLSAFLQGLLRSPRHRGSRSSAPSSTGEHTSPASIGRRDQMLLASD